MQKVDSYAFDISRVKRELLIAVVLLLLSATSATSMWMYYSSLQEQATVSQGDLNRKQQRLQRYISVQTMSEDYQDAYESLQAENYFRDDLKLQWLEKIKESSQRFLLPSVRYDIAQRQRAPLSEELDSGIGIYQTRIELRLGMLHEGDLNSVASYLESSALGLYTVDACRVSRIKNELPVAANEPYINAHCTLTSYDFIFDDDSNDTMDQDVAMVN